MRRDDELRTALGKFPDPCQQRQAPGHRQGGLGLVEYVEAARDAAQPISPKQNEPLPPCAPLPAGRRAAWRVSKNPLQPWSCSQLADTP
ncbi:hypothetical protein GCM10027059_22540 [Myceligenerans halotolerans]